mmetsp:Transcript_23803/g.42889  ORF Transcript_23803/g.42889 Transcript_23803/m.42889 type:complete len:276 (+) Transcript_23803:2041-2868(+)
MPSPRRQSRSHLRHHAGLRIGGQRIDHIVQVALHDLIQLIKGQVDPVIRHAALRKIIGPDPLGPIPRPYLRRPIGRAFAVHPLTLQIIEARTQDLHGNLAVAVLGFLGTGDDKARGQVGDADRGIGGVHVLPASARGAHGIDANVAGVHLDIHIFGLWQDRDSGGRGVDAPAAFGCRHTLHAVHTGFVFQPGKDILALDMGDHFFDAAQLGRLLFDDLHAPALPFGIALVHPQKVARKQRRFVAARPGTDLQHRRAGIRRVLGQERQLQRGFGVR